MGISKNLLDQALDLAGSLNKSDIENLDYNDESRGVGAKVGAAMSGVSAVGGVVTGLSGMTANDVGLMLDFGGTDIYLITEFVSSSSVKIANTGFVIALANNVQKRKPYSLESDMNYARKDRAAIKGVAYDAALPTWTNAAGDQTDANLSNLAAVAADKYSFIMPVAKELRAVSGSEVSFDRGSMDLCTGATSKIGIPVFDADAGNAFKDDWRACYVDVVNADTGEEFVDGTGAAPKKVFGITYKGAGNNVKVKFFSVAVGSDLSNAAPFSLPANSNVNMTFGNAEKLTDLSPTAFRSVKVLGLSTDADLRLDVDALQTLSGQGDGATYNIYDGNRIYLTDGYDGYTNATVTQNFIDLDNALSGVAIDLSTEVSRAYSTEQALSGAISSEVSRAGSAEASLDSALSAEISRAESVESDLSDTISAEISRAIDAENSIVDDLSTEISRASSAEDSLTTLVSTEVSRATSAEASLASDLSTESSRAVSAEGSLAIVISTESSRAISAEGSLATVISTESSRAVSAEGSLASDLSTESSRAVSAEGSIASALSTESSRAVSVEGSLASSISTEVSRATSAEASIVADLSVEIYNTTPVFVGKANDLFGGKTNRQVLEVLANGLLAAGSVTLVEYVAVEIPAFTTHPIPSFNKYAFTEAAPQLTMSVYTRGILRVAGTEITPNLENGADYQLIADGYITNDLEQEIKYGSSIKFNSTVKAGDVIVYVIKGANLMSTLISNTEYNTISDTYISDVLGLFNS